LGGLGGGWGVGGGRWEVGGDGPPLPHPPPHPAKPAKSYKL